MTLQEFFDTDYFKALMFESICYRALDHGGVDNWSWYGQSYKGYNARDGRKRSSWFLKKRIWKNSLLVE